MLKRFWWMFIVMIPVGMILGLLTSAVITYKMPKLFESEGIIEVTLPSQVAPPAKLPKPEQFSEQELGKITEASILERVVDGLDLPSRWGMGRDEATRLLKESVHCRLAPDANRISIKVRCQFKEDARDIAVAIIQCYLVLKAQPSDAEQVKALSDLNKQIDEQNIRTTESRNAIKDRGGKAPLKGSISEITETEKESEFQANVLLLENLERRFEELGKSIEPSLAKVTVHQIPEIPEKVVSPDIPQNLLIGKVAGILLSPLLAWPVIVFLERRSKKMSKVPKVEKAEKTAAPGAEW